MAVLKSDFDIKRNLIVNYLPGNLSQDEVKAMFNNIGDVENCKLIRNHVTGESLGYAFIAFPTEQLASAAIAHYDGMKMGDKTLKVSYARQSSPEIKDSNVYVAGLPNWVTEDKLLSLFAPFGNIITHKLLLDVAGITRGVGFVRYSLKQEAQNAIESMAGKMLQDAAQPLIVKLAIPPASKQQLNPGTASLIAMNRANSRFNPMAVPNRTVTAAQNALSAGLPGNSNPIATGLPVASPLVGNGLSIPQACQAKTTGQAYSVYVYGLQPMHTELTLYELFAPFGSILNVKLMRDLQSQDKACKGYGFVNFNKYEEAYSAVASMNGCPFDGKNLQVSFKSSKHGANPGLPEQVLVQQHVGLLQPPVSIPTTPVVQSVRLAAPPAHVTPQVRFLPY